jgi:hypothetical protein
MVEQDFTEFYKSLGKELIAVKNRVRSLIGDANWGEDGRYREAVLKNIISKFLPKNYCMGTGFVINARKELTKQIDIIIYDNSSPVLFSEGDFVIVPANTVKAIIEVKSSINDTNSLKEIIKTCEENAKKIELNFALAKNMFNGIFCYECDLSFNTLRDSLKECYHLSDCSIYRKMNNLSLGDDKFIHLWDAQPFSLRGYELKGLSFAYFISNLLTHLDSCYYENKSLFFPLESKNPYEQFKIDYPQEEFKRW